MSINNRKEPQVLEAVTAMARIATLAFNPDGSKIAFRNHNIVICPPESTSGIISNIVPQKLIQGIDRYWNSDSRDDLHIFNHVIKNYIDLYMIPYKKKNMKTYNNLINLAKYTCVGLIKLQRTYSEQHCNAVLVVQLYINILRDIIRGKHDPTSFYVPYGQITKPIINNDEQEQNLTLSNIFDMEKIKAFWSQKELDKLCEQFDGCFKNQGEVDDVIFSNNPQIDSGISNIVNQNELMTFNNFQNNHSNNNSNTNSNTNNNRIITNPFEKNTDSGMGSLIDIFDSGESNTQAQNQIQTQTQNQNQNQMQNQMQTQNNVHNGNNSNKEVEHEFILPRPSNQALPIVKGLIVSINEILDAMDKRFSLVLTQSIQGISK